MSVRPMYVAAGADGHTLFSRFCVPVLQLLFEQVLVTTAGGEMV